MHMQYFNFFINHIFFEILKSSQFIFLIFLEKLYHASDYYCLNSQFNFLNFKMRVDRETASFY